MSDQPKPVPIAPHMHVGPGPLTWAVGEVPLANGNKAILIRFEHLNGSFVAILTPADAEKLEQMLHTQNLQTRTGLTLPGGFTPPGNGNGLHAVPPPGRKPRRP